MSKQEELAAIRELIKQEQKETEERDKTKLEEGFTHRVTYVAHRTGRVVGLEPEVEEKFNLEGDDVVYDLYFTADPTEALEELGKYGHHDIEAMYKRKESMPEISDFVWTILEILYYSRPNVHTSTFQYTIIDLEEKYR